MIPVTCPNASCGHAFVAATSGSVACPSCGDTVDLGATVIRDFAPAADFTVDSPTSAGPAIPVKVIRIGRFVLRGRLGEGAFGEVFRAYDEQLDREVALKVAKPSALSTPDRVQRFLREAKAAANLRHPNIVPLFDAGQANGRSYIASAFIPGRTLEAEIADAAGKPIKLKRAAKLIRRLAGALGYAHRQGITHRDVKPANTLIDEAGEPHLLDFGLAARAGDEALQTRDGSVMGTPAYMSPEQAAGRSAEATAASDQYALGVMLFELTTGRRPFTGSMESLLLSHIRTAPPRPRSVNRAVPRDLETVILKCLEKQPAKRYANCEALAEDLRRFAAGEPVAARRIGSVERTSRWAKRNPAVAGSLAFAALALVIGTGVSLWQVSVARDRTSEAKRAGANEEDQKKIAEGKAEEAKKEAARANGEKERASEAESETLKKAAGLATQLKETSRLRDLGKLKDAQVAYDGSLVQAARKLLSEIAPENRCVVWEILNRRVEGCLFTLAAHTGEVLCGAATVRGSSRDRRTKPRGCGTRGPGKPYWS